MELQQLTEQMLLAVTSLNRSCIPQSVQEPLKGENFLLDYLSAQTGCSPPGALREVLGVRAPRTAALLRELGRRTAEQARASLCAHVQCVRKQLGEQDARELIRLLGRITEIEAGA